jgi:hypothetical protein
MQLSPAGPTGVATGTGFQPTGGGKAAGGINFGEANPSSIDSKFLERPYSFSFAANLNPKIARPPATIRPTQLTHFGTDQSAITVGYEPLYSDWGASRGSYRFIFCQCVGTCGFSLSAASGTTPALRSSRRSSIRLRAARSGGLAILPRLFLRPFLGPLQC